MSGLLPMTLVGESQTTTEEWEFTFQCECGATVHMWVPYDGESGVRIRHGEGEAYREFGKGEWYGRSNAPFSTWVREIHAHERAS